MQSYTVLPTLLGQLLGVQIFWTVKHNTVVMSFKECGMSNAVDGTI